MMVNVLTSKSSTYLNNVVMPSTFYPLKDLTLATQKEQEDCGAIMDLVSTLLSPIPYREVPAAFIVHSNPVSYRGNQSATRPNSTRYRPPKANGKAFHAIHESWTMSWFDFQ